VLSHNGLLIGSESCSCKKEWEGQIEKEFTIVVYSEMKKLDKVREYYFRLLNEGNDSAKTPPMFVEALGGDEIPNDCNALLQTVRKVLNS
jgi:hypothetical protein